MSTVFTRRKAFGFAAAFACPLCARALAADAPHWGYEGPTGPAHWGDLESDFRACSIGTQQSPINLTGAVDAALGHVDVGYQEVPLRVWNNGHYIQINVPPGNKVNLAGVSYELLQFHFHHPSEHQLEGQRYDMEAHFVNRAADGTFCALGAFIKRGASNPVLGSVVKAMQSTPGPDTPVPGVTVDPMSLLPNDRTSFRYMGSVTTPPCPETVSWVVFRTPIEASPEEIKGYAAVFPLDARPIQPLNRRFVLEVSG
ncbi:MAG: carbonic anhydrase [Roseiarcus sp.]